MYLAQNSNSANVQSPMYINVLENIVENGDSKGKSGIENAIKEAKNVAEDKKDIFSVNNEFYFFITTLLAKFKEELIEMNVNNIQISDYKKIMELFK